MCLSVGKFLRNGGRGRDGWSSGVNAGSWRLKWLNKVGKWFVEIVKAMTKRVYM